MNDDLQKIYQQWQLSNVRSFQHIAMTHNYVASAYSDQHRKDVVLKVGPKKVIDKEIQALQYFQGDACVKLLAFDQEFSDKDSALLLEYVQPGNSLKDLFLQNREEELIEIFAQVVKKIHENSSQKNHEVFQSVEQRLSLLHSFNTQNDRLQKLLSQAAKMAHQLVAKQGVRHLLHGDLHHENILQRGDTWVMIDPQGVVGELEYEVGAFIYNPLFELLEQPNLEQLILYRFERLSQLLNLHKQRMIDWSFVQAVLAACFAEEDENQRCQNYFLTIAELILNITQNSY